MMGGVKFKYRNYVVMLVFNGMQDLSASMTSTSLSTFADRTINLGTSSV